MYILSAIILANILISLGSLVGVFTLAVSSNKLTRILMCLVSFSAGTLMGGAFLHLLPEAAESLPFESVLLISLISFIGFLLIEKIFMWRHCHKGHCDVHTFGYMNLIGDAIHNFIDGLVIAAAFTSDPNLGIVTTLAVAAHEIPQEIGDFGVLVYSGMTKTKALIANLAIALTSVAGGVIGYLITFGHHQTSALLLPVAAGGFIYIAASDLLPEMRKETRFKKSLLSLLLFMAGIGLMYLVGE